ncbi:hypothetical protein RSSM_03075 [Rhodopirellula sallentina SM41]|uniref:Uncharacterized protein n=1 Tax=Rhodopirellula sallentina SM41 TaxID=1263870 RepID=M5UCC6_9BACT|nr:hypothetical protein RSSM_03075 [Rhodopirellula sallentina SM41]
MRQIVSKTHFETRDLQTIAFGQTRWTIDSGLVDEYAIATIEVFDEPSRLVTG